MEKEVSIPNELNSNKLEELVNRVPYISEQILNVTLSENQQNLNIHFEAEADFVYFEKEYMKLLENISKHRMIEKKVLFSNEESNFVKTNEKKQKRNYYEETELQILNFIDNQLVNLAKQYGALIREYPTLLSYENMVKNNYHKNFPQNIYSPFEIEHNYKLIEEIRNQTEKNIKDETFKSSGYFLQPCICYHCYEELQDCNIENIVFTGKGKCYRHEVEWKKSTYRKNEFYMREIVYFGEKNNVLKIRENLIKEVWAFFKELNLVGKIETATDPFFFYDDMKKSTYQLMTEAKYELVAKISEEKDISIASFNFCNNNLCDAYNIRNSKEELLFSGCTAFGLDRWVALILNTLGEDLDKWPERIRNKLYECNPK